jgi:hypothetical protein
VLDTYQFERLSVRDVCITPDGQRLLGFGTLLSSGAGLKPSKCRAEKQIIGALDVLRMGQRLLIRACDCSLQSRPQGHRDVSTVLPPLYSLAIVPP